MGNIWLDKDTEIEDCPTVSIKIEIVYNAGGSCDLFYPLSKSPIKRIISVAPMTASIAIAPIPNPALTYSVTCNNFQGIVNMKWTCDPGPHEIIVEYEW